MLSRVGRPREHDQLTAAALLAAGERAVAEGGLEALSVRGRRRRSGHHDARRLQPVWIQRRPDRRARRPHLPPSRAPRWSACRRRPTRKPTWSKPDSCFAASRSSIPRCSRSGSNARSPAQSSGRNSVPPPTTRSPSSANASPACRRTTCSRGRTVRDATTQFHALCEGLAALELREALPPKDAERIWRDALTALIAGFAITPPRQRSGPTIPARRPIKHDPVLTTRPSDGLQRPSVRFGAPDRPRPQQSGDRAQGLGEPSDRRTLASSGEAGGQVRTWAQSRRGLRVPADQESSRRARR